MHIQDVYLKLSYFLAIKREQALQLLSSLSIIQIDFNLEGFLYASVTQIPHMVVEPFAFKWRLLACQYAV